MPRRVIFSERPAKRTRWLVSHVPDDGLNGPILQVNALYRWILIYLN